MSKTALLTDKLLIRLGQPEDSMRVVSRRPLDMLKQGELDFVWSIDRHKYALYRIK
jgi:hypothetical protein